MEETEAGETLYKRWWSTRDGKTRATHRAAHGQTVPIGEPFTVGAAQLTTGTVNPIEASP